jgi:hypothetical protein
VFQAVCGFNCHGPRGRLEFAPRLAPDNFRAAFTSAEGWGTLTQTRDGKKQACRIDVKHGRLRLRTMALSVDGVALPETGTIKTDGAGIASVRRDGDRIEIDLDQEVVLAAGESLQLQIE